MAYLKTLLQYINRSSPKIRLDRSLLYKQQHYYSFYRSSAIYYQHSYHSKYYTTSTVINEANENIPEDKNNINYPEELVAGNGSGSECGNDQQKFIIATQDRTSDEIWQDFLIHVKDPKATLNDSDFIHVCYQIKKQDPPAIAIKRIQFILRELHKQDRETPFVVCCNMLIHLYFAQDEVDKATLVFDGLIRSKYKPTEATVTTLLYGYAGKGKINEVRRLYKKLSKLGLFPETTRSYYSLIKVLGIILGDAESASSIFYMLQKREKQKKDDDDNKNSNTIIMHEAFYVMMYQIFRKTNQPELAWELFQKMINEDKGIVSSSFGCFSLLLTFQQAGNMEKQAQKVYEYMVKNKVEFKVNHFQAMEWDTTRILEEIKNNKSLIMDETRDFNALMAYAVKKNDFENALKVFDHMLTNEIQPDVFTYGIIMDALIKDVDQPVEKVYEVYEEIKQKKIQPDAVIYSILLQACGRQGDSERAIQYLQEMLNYNIQLNNYIVNDYLSLLSRKPVLDHVDIERAKLMWDHMTEMKLDRDTRSYNNYLALLSRIVPSTEEMREDFEDNDVDRNAIEFKDEDIDKIYYSENQEESYGGGVNNMVDRLDNRHLSYTARYMMKLYRTMRKTKSKGCQPDFVTYAVLINTMISHGQTRKTMLLYREAQEDGIKLSVSVYNQIMHGLLRTKDLHQVMQVWQDMKAHDILPDEKSYQHVLDTCEQLHLTKSLKAIENQYILDQPRLQKLKTKSEKRIRKAREIKNQ